MNRADNARGGPEGDRRLRAHDPAAPARLARPRPSTSRSGGAASGSRSGSREEELLSRGGRAVADDRRPAGARPTTTSTTSTKRPDDEVEEAEEEVVDQATAARTIAELQSRDRRSSRASRSWPARSALSGTDRKWDELSEPPPGRHGREMFDAARPPPQAHHLHRAPRHAQLPRRPDRRPARPARGRRHHPRRHGPRGAPQGPGALHPGQGRSRSWSPPTRRARASTSSAPT